MAGSNYLGRAGAYAMHKRYPAGSQTAEQLKAERANLVKARAARGLMHHTRSVKYHGLRKPSAKQRENAMAARIYRMNYLRTARFRPVGTRFVQYQKLGRLKKPRITGIPKHFISRTSPARYLGRTQWGAARGHTFKKRLTRRSHRFRQEARWKQRGKRYTPR
jgi:hypothetical protein